MLTLTKSKLSPVILIVQPPTTTVYLNSPILASLVLKLCMSVREARAECGKALSSDAEEFTLELDPVRGPPTAMPCSLTGEAFRRIVSSINCLAWLK